MGLHGPWRRRIWLPRARRLSGANWYRRLSPPALTPPASVLSWLRKLHEAAGHPMQIAPDILAKPSGASDGTVTQSAVVPNSGAMVRE